jgi:MFS family permease
MMTNEEEHASSFGALSVFRSCGYLIAPILLGFVLSGLSFLPFILAWFFLLVSFFVFLFLLKTAGKGENKAEKSMVKKSRLLPEFTLWRRVGKLLFPFLFLMTIMHIYNAVFWTIGPIFSESFPGLGNFSGIFLAAFLFSPLIFGWLVGPAVKVLGKRNSVIFCFLAGSLLLSLFSLFSNLYFLIALIFVSSGLVTIAWSSINGIFSDYLSESVVLDGEIEGLADFFTNLGYIIGPALAGFLAEKVGSGNAFTVIGLLGFSATLLVFLFLPKRIRFVEPSLLKA